MVNVKGSEKVELLFGYWPSFHDSEVLTISLDRAGPTLVMSLLSPAFQDVKSPTHYLIAFKFHQVDGFELQGFNYQNVIGNLDWSYVSEKPFYRDVEETRIRIELSPIFGAAICFTCSEAEVISIEPTDQRTGFPAGPTVISAPNI